MNMGTRRDKNCDDPYAINQNCCPHLSNRFPYLVLCRVVITFTSVPAVISGIATTNAASWPTLQCIIKQSCAHID